MLRILSASDIGAVGAYLERSQRGDDRIVFAAKDQTDVGMCDEPAGAIQNESVAGFADTNGGDYFPDQLQVNLADGDAGARPRAGYGDRDERLGASMQGKRAKPHMGGACAYHRRVRRAIDAAHHDIGIGARDTQALCAIAVDQRHLGDSGRLPHEKQHVETVAFVGSVGPGQLDSPFS